MMKNCLIKSAALVSLCLLISAFCFAQNKELDPRAGKRKIDPNSKAVIFTLAKNGEILLGSEKISAGKVTEKVNRLMESRPIDQEIVYIVAGSDKNYGEIADFIKLSRKAWVKDFGFLVLEDAEREVATALGVKVLPELRKSETVRPNPLLLVIQLGNDRRVNLNGKAMMLENLAETLSRVFREREEYGVYREGSNEVETTVFIRAAPDAKFGEVIKVIKTVKNAGAYPVSLDVDATSKL